MIGYLGLPSLRKSGYRLRNVSFKQLGFCFCSIKLNHVFFAAIYTLCNMHTFFMQSTVMFVQRTERYSTVEKECLATKLAVQAFKIYMLDRLKENNARLTWWSLSLQPYVYSVCHHTGEANGNADALSRAMSN